MPSSGDRSRDEPMVEPIGVAVVHPETADRELLASVLEREIDIEVLGAASDGPAAIELAGRVEPDVVVLEVGLPQLDGVRATQIVTELEPPPAVLALAAAASRELAFDAIRAGAAGFCAHDSSPVALAEAVRGVASGHAVVERAVLRELVDRVPLGSVALDHFTPREREVMALVAQGATNPEVCQQLVITDATVGTHVRSLRRKLGARTRAELVSRVYGLGLRQATATLPLGGDRR